MKFGETSFKTKLVFYIVVGVFLVLATSTAVIISTVTSQEKDLAYQQSIEMAGNYANQFNSDFSSDKVLLHTSADFMSQYESKNRTEISNFLEQLLLDHPDLIGVYIAYEPDAFDGTDSQFVNFDNSHDSTGRFIPYWNRIGGDEFVEPLVDYDIEDYYQLPKNKKEYVLTEPYLYQGILIVSHVEPIIKDDEFVGLVGADVSVEYVDTVMQGIKAFDTGYAVVVSNGGILLSHPEEKEWIGRKKLSDFGIPEMSSMADEIKKGNDGFIETVDPTTGKDVIMFYEPIKTGNFGFVLVVPKDEMLAGVTHLRNKLGLISGISLIFMGCVAYMIARSVTRPIDDIVDDFKKISDESLKGNLNVRANADVEVDFKEIPLGLNEILDVLNKVTSKHKEAEESLLKYAKELEKSNRMMEQMETVVNNSPVVVFLWKAQKDWPVEMVSQNVSQFGYDAEDFTSGKILYGDVIHPNDREKFSLTIYNNFVNLHNHFSMEYRLITKFGEVRWIDSRNLIMRDEEGGITHYQGIILDITERKRAEELSKTNEDLRSMDKMKDLFTDILRHDLLNPAGVIKGFTDVLLDMEDDDRKVKVLQTIRRNNEKLIGLIEMSAKLAKLEDVNQLQFQRMDIGLFLKEVGENFGPHLAKKNISLEMFLDNEYPAMVNPVIEEVFSNLLSNAIKYSPEDSRILISVLDEGVYWKTCVTDFGEGILDEDKPYIFNRFIRAEKGSIKGSGIGLAIVKRIIELHGGDAGVEDNYRGKGSIFWVTVKKDI